MLTITHEAANLLENQRDMSGAPDSYGIRVFAAAPEEGGEPELAITFVPEASPGDEVVEQDGLMAYVAPEVSDQLDGATLDATPTNGTPQQLLIRR